MSGEAVKGYIYLLCEAWLQEPRATLPNSDAELASMARMSEAKWMVAKHEIMPRFKVGECEEHNGRLYNELQLELSRKSEAKQRLNNKNAKRSQSERKKSQHKRKLNAGLEYEDEDETASDNGNPLT